MAIFHCKIVENRFQIEYNFIFQNAYFGNCIGLKWNDNGIYSKWCSIIKNYFAFYYIIEYKNY